MGVGTRERIARQERAAALEDEVRELRDILEARRRTLARETAESAGRAHRIPLAGALAVLGSLVALVAGLAFVAMPRESASRCSPLPDPLVPGETSASAASIAPIGARADPGVFETFLSGRLDAAPRDAGVERGVRCIIQLTGRRYAERVEVEQVTASCGTGWPGRSESVRVFQGSVDADPRAPARRLETLEADVSPGDRRPAVALSGTWRGADGSRDIASVDSKEGLARFTTRAASGEERVWSIALGAH